MALVEKPGMYVTCPGGFGDDHGPVVIGEHPGDGLPSHGICLFCRRVIDTALVHEETKSLEPIAVANNTRRAHDLELRSNTVV
jgi:hypothetical protein